MKYNLINFCENDKYAIKSYCAIHNESEDKNLGDITQVDISKLPQCDMITHGSPCQDFSVAGLQAGGDEGSETRSSLIWNSVKIIQHCNPKFIIWENVKNVLNEKHIHNFEKYLSTMKDLGYINYYKVLNAKDYGVPQNRERIFCISVRKDIDCGFEFPSKYIFTPPLRNFCEKQEFGEIIEKRYDEGIRHFKHGVCGTLRTITRCGDKYWFENGVIKRGLSPLESFRLMGFDDSDFKKINNFSNNVLYKQAGNSIVVNVITEIYKQLLLYYPNDFKDDISLISLFSGIGAFEKAFCRL